MESWLIDREHALSEDSVDQMLILAERLRAANGGQLDDSAIQAVSEATGAPAEYVRLAVKLRGEKEKRSFVADVRTQFLTLDLNVRRYVVSGASAALCAFFAAASNKASAVNQPFGSGILGVIALLWLTLGLYNACVSRDSKTGAIVGGIFAGGFFAAYELFGFFVHLSGDQALSPFLFPPTLVVGALAGLSLQRTTDRYRPKLGLRDPVEERQELLRQLQDLQDKLKSGEQICTFLSVDIVGSTKMKEKAEPLALEYTFNEYHQFVDWVTRKHNGRVHSTAGDGVTAVFDNPRQAFAAARNISAGMLEVNTLRNKVGIPIVLRQGLHTGTVMAPSAGDITSVNFAHVIDIAAHLQKATPPGTIVVSDASAAYLPGGAMAVGTQRVSASGVEGTVWAPRSTQPKVAAGGGPPPLPDAV